MWGGCEVVASRFYRTLQIGLCACYKDLLPQSLGSVLCINSHV